MATTSKISEIGTQREYDYKEKHYRATVLIMENWDKWECSKEKADAFTIWQELVYNLKPNGDYTPKMYLETPKQFWNKSSTWKKEDPVEKFIGFALSYAKDIVIAEIMAKEEKSEWVLKIADQMFDWMIKKHKENQPVQATQTQQTTPVAQTPASDLITPEQVKYAHTLWGKTWLNDEAWKKYLQETYKVWSSKELTKHQATQFIDYIKTIEPLPLPTTPSADEDLPF